MMMPKKWNTVLWLLSLLFLFVLSGETHDIEKEQLKNNTASVIKLTENIYRITLQFGLRPNSAVLTGPDEFCLLIQEKNKQLMNWYQLWKTLKAVLSNTLSTLTCIMIMREVMTLPEMTRR